MLIWALDPHLRLPGLKRCFIPAYQNDSITEIPLSKALEHPATVFRLFLLSVNLTRVLKSISHSRFCVEFPVSSEIIARFHHLDMLNRLILRLDQIFDSASGDINALLLAFVMLQTRAVVCHQILLDLEPFIKAKLRSAPSDVPNFLGAFLILLSEEVATIGRTHNCVTSSESGTVSSSIASS
jgi:hypothetical protein